MTKKMTVDETEAFLRQVKLLIIVFIAVFCIPVIIYAVYLDSRLESFENALRYSSPEDYQSVETLRGDLHYLTENPVEGQVVYVPAYSHVYHGSGEPHLLTITLSIRNTSMDSEIVVQSVRYFDTKGKEVKSYLKKPVRLPALGTTEILVERDDSSGGSGANFLVEWFADTPVTEPIVEAVMIDTKSQQGISFVRRGSVLSEAIPKSISDDTIKSKEITESE